MQYSIALPALAFAGAVLAVPQGVTGNIAPSSLAPAGCQPSYSGSFQITVQNVTSTVSKRQSDDSTLTLKLANGVLTDQDGRTGYIAANRQFQFDKPPQTGAIYTAGFSVCGNGSLALGSSSIFYQCLSGDFYNLYDQSQGNQCGSVYILASGSSASASAGTGAAGSGAASSGAATQASDGQPGAATSAVSQISDGQVQATTAAVSQISDGQVQATSSAAAVSQISDGQVQATTSAAVVSQISDGQVQATTSAAVVSQISDGQIQATTSAAVVSQISDGQIQATTAQNATATISRPAVYTGAAGSIALGNEFMAAALGLAAVAML